MFQHHVSLTTAFVATVALLGARAAPSRGCALCIGFPEKTATDHILDADLVVLARPSNESPYVYARGERLKGMDPGGEINLLVDTRTRRLMSAVPRRHAVLVLSERSEGWRSLGVASDDYLAILRRIAFVGADWEGAEGAEQRWRFFLPLFGHDDPSVRQLAYLEMGRAPYPVIQQLGRLAPRDVYAPLLQDPKYLKWRSLAILLLAQSDDPNDHRIVRDSYASAKRLRMTTNLGAWAAALIEIDGETAIADIEDAYLRSQSSSVEEVDAMVNALSMHGQAAGSLVQDRVIDSYRLLLNSHPSRAPRVVADLTAWGRSDLVKELSACLERYDAFDVEERVGIHRYLRSEPTSKELAGVSD